MSHSREPWIWLSTGGSWEVACCMEDDPRQIALLPDENEADAHRICAAVNACVGIPTEALENNVVAELLQELIDFHDHTIDQDWHTCDGIPGGCPVVNTIAKAKGEAP